MVLAPTWAARAETGWNESALKLRAAPPRDDGTEGRLVVEEDDVLNGLEERAIEGALALESSMARPRKSAAVFG